MRSVFPFLHPQVKVVYKFMVIGFCSFVWEIFEFMHVDFSFRALLLCFDVSNYTRRAEIYGLLNTAHFTAL